MIFETYFKLAHHGLSYLHQTRFQALHGHFRWATSGSWGLLSDWPQILSLTEVPYTAGCSSDRASHIQISLFHRSRRINEHIPDHNPLGGTRSLLEMLRGAAAQLSTTLWLSHLCCLWLINPLWTNIHQGEKKSFRISAFSEMLYSETKAFLVPPVHLPCLMNNWVFLLPI